MGDQYATSIFDNNSSLEAHGGASNSDSGGTVLTEDGLVWGQMTWTSPEPGTVVDGRKTGILMASENEWVYDTMYSIAVANGASNNVPIAWLEGMGYTNEFDVAALDDPDGDDFANWQEYHADTIPTNGNDYLMLVMASNQLVFASSSNCIYEVQWNDNLSSNVWNSLTNDLAGTGGDLSVTDTNNVPVRFYQLNAERVSQ